MATLRVAFLSALVLELLVDDRRSPWSRSASGCGCVDGHMGLRTALLVLILAPEAYLPLRAVGAQYHASAEGLAAADGAIFEVVAGTAPASGTGTDVPADPSRDDGPCWTG